MYFGTFQIEAKARDENSLFFGMLDAWNLLLLDEVVDFQWLYGFQEL